VAMGSAVRSTVPPGLGVVTVNLGVTFLHSAKGSLTAEGRVLRGGRTLVFCEGEARDADGHLVAKGVGTFRLKRRKPQAGARQK